MHPLLARIPSARGIRAAAWAAGPAACVALAIACASPPPAPTAAIAAAQESIADAEKSAAGQYAGAELDEARQRLVLAELAVEAQNMREADRLAQESKIAAELASARTEAAKAGDINREMRRGAEALTEEMRRRGEQR